MRILFQTILLCALFAFPSHATNYYVSPSGDDSNDGLSLSEPWQSINNGDQEGILLPGDTVNILPGLYLLSSSIQLTSDGLDTAVIVYRKLGKGKAVVDGNNQNNILIIIESDYIEVSGLELTNTTNHGIHAKGDYLTISNCFLHAIGKMGVRFEGESNILHRNVIYDTGEEGIKNEASGKNGLIYNNTISSCGLEGIELKSGSSRAINNIVAQNDKGIKGEATDFCAFNNVWGNTATDYEGVSDSAGGISKLPKFVDPASGRFDLMAASFDIDAGMDLGYSYNGSAPDIGAFEKYNVYFVSETGSDLYSGLTTDSAWASIDNGDSLLYPGDTVYVLPGTYTDSVVITDSGLVDDKIAYVGFRDSCLIDGTGLGNVVTIEADHVLWSGINVTAATSANILISGNANLIQESTVSGSSLHGLHIRAGQQNAFKNNVFSQNEETGLYIRDDYVTIYNCSFYDSAGFSIDAQGYQYLKIANCIFLGSSGENTAVMANATSELTYSIFYNNLETASGGIGLGTGCFISDPLFIDPDAGNFRLQSLSPAIDAGVNIGLPFEGTAPDRGAYETGIVYSLEIIPAYDSLIADSAYRFSVLAYDIEGYPATPGTIAWTHTFASGEIDDNGLFSPQLIGTGEIGAESSIGAVFDLSPTMTVVPGTLNQLSISPTTDTLSTDETISFTASGADKWGNAVTELGTLTWEVLNNIGTIDSAGLFTATTIGDGLIRVTSDLGPTQITGTITVTPGGITYIDVSPPTNIIITDSSFQYAAYGLDADSNIVRDLTDSVTWSTNDPGGSITASGLYTAGSAPSPPIYYVKSVYQGVIADSGQVSVISDGSLSYIQIEWQDGTPFSETTLSTDNDTVRLYSRGYTSSDVLLGDISVDWAMIGFDSIGSVTPRTGTSTALELYSPGTGQITAFYSANMVDTTDMITCMPGLPNYAVISPDTATLITDSSLTFTMEFFDADSNLCAIGPIPEWSVIGGIGNIDPSGVFTPGAVGTGYIVGKSGSVADTTGEIAVTAGTLSYISVSPDSVLLSADSTLLFSVNGYDANHNLQDPGDITWTLTNALGSIDADGLYDAVATGVTRVVATSNLGLVDTSAYLEIIPGHLVSLTISPDSIDITTDSSIVLSVAGVDADNNPASIGIIDWTVIGDIGDINSAGLFTPLTAGLGRIMAVSSIDGIADTNKSVIVNPGVLEILVVSPDNAAVDVGDTINFSAVGYDNRYNLTDIGQVSWLAFGGMGNIDSNGTFIAQTPGSGYINAISSIDGISDMTGSIIVEAMGISAIPLGNRYVRPNQKSIPLMAFRMENYYSIDKNMETVIIRDLSSGPGNPAELLTNVDSLSIYIDQDNDSTLSPADILLVADEYSNTSMSLTFPAVPISPTSGQNFIICGNISLNPHDTDSIDIFLTPTLDIQFSEAAAIYGPDTINSLGLSIINGMVKEQLIVSPAGNTTIIPGDTIYNCITIDIPRNGYLSDVLRIIDLANSGTAGIDDIDSLILYVDDGNGTWGGPSEETKLGRMAFTGDQWTRSGLAMELAAPLTRFYVGARLADYPDNGATIAFYVPTGGLEMSSDNDGPIDGPTTPADIITIQTNENVLLTTAAIPARELIPGIITQPLAGFKVTNSYNNGLVLDSLECALLANDDDGATREQLDSQVDSLLLYINNDGDFNFIGGADLLIATATVTDGKIVFNTGGLTIPQNGGIVELSVAASLNLNNCKDGNTLNIAISEISHLYFDLPVSIIGDFPAANHVDFPINAFPAEKIVINTVDGSTLYGGQSDRLVSDFILPGNGYASGILQSLNIYNKGTLNEFDALLSVKLYADDGDNLFSKDDIYLGRFVPQYSFWRIDDISYNLGTAGARFYITVDVITDHSEAGTLLFNIPVQGAGYFSGMTGPDDTEVGNPDAHLVFPSNRIFAISIPAAGSDVLTPQSKKNVALSFALYNGYVDQDQTLEAFSLSNVSKTFSNLAYSDYELGQVSLYMDTDSSRTFNGDSLIASGIFGGGRLQLGGLDIVLQPEDLKYFFIVNDVPMNLIDSDSLAVSIESASDFTFGQQVSIGGDLPLTSGSYLIVDGSIKQQYDILEAPSRSISPSDTSVTLFAFNPALNGDQPDTLQALTVENIAAAGPGDFHSLELWQDLDGDDIWQDSDIQMGLFNFTGSAWEISGLSIDMALSPPTLFIIADIADTTAATSSFRAQVPVDGCLYSSGNDGPIDVPLTSENAVTVSSSWLAVAAGELDETYSVGQTFDLRLTVTNRTDQVVNQVSGELVGGFDSSVVSLESSLSGPVTLAAHETTEFVYTFSTLSPGIVSWRLRAITPAIPDSSAIIETAPTLIQATPGDVTLQFVNSIPTAVIKGQANVFPLSIGYEHPDTQPTTASLRLDSLRLSFEDESGSPVAAGSAFDRISLVTGYANLAVMETIPDQSQLWLVFSEPVVVSPGQRQQYSLLIDIAADADAGSFAIALPDAAAIPIIDNNNRQTVSIDPAISFPLKTASCRIDNPSSHMFVSYESVVGPTANYGQQNLAVIKLNLRHPGVAGSSQIQFTSMDLHSVDSLASMVPIGDLIDEITIRKQASVIGGTSGIALGSQQAVIDFYSPVTLSPGESEELTIEVSVRSESIHRGFSLYIPDSSAFRVRDLSSGSMLDAATDTLILAAGLSTFPLVSDWVALMQPASAPEICLMSNLPISIIGGADSVKLLEVEMKYPVPEDRSSVSIRNARMVILDTLGHPLGPDLLFDRIGYCVSGGGIDYQPYVMLENGQVVFTFGDDGGIVNPGDSFIVCLAADIKPDAPYDHFLLRLEDASDVLIYDVSDTTHHPSLITGPECNFVFPFESDVSQILNPAGRPGLKSRNMPLITMSPGQKQARVFNCDITYETEGLHGDVNLSGLRGCLLRRTVDNLVSANPADIFETVDLAINDMIIPAAPIMHGDTIEIIFENDYIISRGDGFNLSLIGDIKNDAVLGNYLICFTDSTFLDMTDRELSTTIFPTLTDALYPLYSAQLSLAAADLEGSFRNFPNPFYPSRGEVTRIAYTLTEDAHVDIEIFSITGEGVKTVASNTFREAGSYQDDIWEGLNDIGRPVISGTYFCRIIARYSSGKVDELKRKIGVLR